MYRVVKWLPWLFSALVGNATAATEAPVLAVIKFQDETGGMMMSGGAGRALTNMLTSELAARGAFAVIERQKLRAVMEEQTLGVSGRINPETSAAIGKLIGAQYLVTGTVTAYEEDKLTRMKSGFLGVGAHMEEESKGGYLAVDLRVINAQTGLIAFARTIEGHTEGSKRSYAFNEQQSAMEALDSGPGSKAVRAAVIEIIDYLECELVVRNECLQAFAQAEQRRIMKTRKAARTDVLRDSP